MFNIRKERIFPHLRLAIHLIPRPVPPIPGTQSEQHSLIDVREGTLLLHIL
jgi:hypothetical protein